jgi:3-hydroxybutyryl-CoA dehydrogenase
MRVATIIGAGVMGRGIAQVTALAGWRTRLVDVSEDQLDGALGAIQTDLDGGVRRGKVSADTAQAAISRIAATADLTSACRGADLVIEAVAERVEVKQEVLSVAEPLAATDAVLATNTSALSVTTIMSCLEDPSRGLGMHFFNPVPRMRLCELIRGSATAEPTLERAEAFAQAMGKETIRVADVAGFATSRINALIGAEAMRMLEDGVASAEDIDTAVRLGLNHPMGPLEMGDLVGWDTRLAILEYLAEELGDRYAPTALHRQLVAEGRLGRKTGWGIHRYDDDGRRP